MATPPPEVLALVVADYFYRDDEGGKPSLLGIRSSIGATSFPFEHRQLAAYVAMINGRGTVTIGIQLVDTDEEHEPVAEGEVQVTFPDPITEVEVVFELQQVTFPEPGEYRMQLRSDGYFLRERVLVIRQVGGQNAQ